MLKSDVSHIEMSQSVVQSTKAIQQAAKTHQNLPLVPRPTQDDKDPLRWPRDLKLAALAATAFVNFTANFAGSGLSVATPALQAQFHRTSGEVNSLLTVSNRVFEYKGIGPKSKSALPVQLLVSRDR